MWWVLFASVHDDAIIGAGVRPRTGASAVGSGRFRAGRLCAVLGGDRLDGGRSCEGAATLAELEGILPEPQGSAFTALLGIWTDDGRPVGRETAWRYLQSVYVEHYPPENLRRLVHLIYEHLFVGGPEVIVRQLSGYLDDHLHQWLAGPEIRNHLLSLDGVQSQVLAGDGNTLSALAGTKDRFLRRVRGRAPALGLVTRPHLDQLHGRLVAEDGPQIVLCEGRAGSGKSTVAADVLEWLAGQGARLLPFVCRSCRTSRCSWWSVRSTSEQDSRLGRLIAVDARAARFPVGDWPEDRCEPYSPLVETTGVCGRSRKPTTDAGAARAAGCRGVFSGAGSPAARAAAPSDRRATARRSPHVPIGFPRSPAPRPCQAAPAGR
ncbi:hypothetical protein SAMN05428939_6745 [Streptomyces sp. TLI_105]|nr:hypothetical protein SAMN05428939_6745 [Streptomyces sp. TLI_105]